MRGILKLINLPGGNIVPEAMENEKKTKFSYCVISVFKHGALNDFCVILCVGSHAS
jgi:hypothetical protein